MARLQILELPEGTNDDRPPFVLVVDQVPTDDAGFDAIRRDLGTPEGLIQRIGARAVLVFEETIDIPGNDTTAYLDAAHGALPADARYEMAIGGKPVDWTQADEAQTETGKVRDKDAELQAANEWIEQLAAERDEARNWARHGYEIGQKHCGWTDHGVAPAWLTEGWPPHIDTCEHLRQAAGYDEALTRVRAEVARIRTITPTWDPVADLIDAALNGTQQPAEHATPEE